MAKVLEIRDLSFSFPNNKLFDELNFTLEKGEFVGLMGANGKGKSTLIDLIMGIRPVKEGDVRVLGFDPNHNDRKHLARTILVSQSYGLSSTLSAEEVFKTFRIGYSTFNEKRLGEVIEIFAIDPKIRLNHLSEGFKKRVHLAAALATMPRLLLIDEITALIDIVGREKLFRFLKRLNQKEGLSILLASNISEDFEKYRIRTVVLDNGQLNKVAA